MIYPCEFNKEIIDILKWLEDSYSRELINRNYTIAKKYLDAIEEVRATLEKIKKRLLSVY